MTEKELLATVSSNLLIMRKHLRLTQEEASEKIDITKGMLSKYETGTTMPTLYTLYKISEAYGVSVGMILGKEKIVINQDANLLPVSDDSSVKNEHEKNSSAASKEYTYPKDTEYAAHLDDPNKPVSEERVREIIQEAFELYQKKMK